MVYWAKGWWMRANLYSVIIFVYINNTVTAIPRGVANNSNTNQLPTTSNNIESYDFQIAQRQTRNSAINADTYIGQKAGDLNDSKPNLTRKQIALNTVFAETTMAWWLSSSETTLAGRRRCRSSCIHTDHLFMIHRFTSELRLYAYGVSIMLFCLCV